MTGNKGTYHRHHPSILNRADRPAYEEWTPGALGQVNKTKGNIARHAEPHRIAKGKRRRTRRHHVHTSYQSFSTYAQTINSIQFTTVHMLWNSTSCPLTLISFSAHRIAPTNYQASPTAFWLSKTIVIEKRENMVLKIRPAFASYLKMNTHMHQFVPDPYRRIFFNIHPHEEQRGQGIGMAALGIERGRAGAGRR